MKHDLLFTSKDDDLFWKVSGMSDKQQAYSLDSGVACGRLEQEAHEFGVGLWKREARNNP